MGQTNYTIKLGILLILFSFLILFGCVETQEQTNPVENNSPVPNYTADANVQTQSLPLNEVKPVAIMPTADVVYKIEFNKITTMLKGHDFNADLFEQILIFGDPININKVLVNGKEISYDINNYYSDAGYLSNLSKFSKAEVEIDYTYDPDILGGSYCIGNSCIINLYINGLLPIDYTYTLDYNGYNLFDVSLEDNKTDPYYILTKGELYEENGFVLLTSQKKMLEDSKISLLKFNQLVNKTNIFLNKPNKKPTLFLVPEGLLNAYYFPTSSIIVLPLYESNEANSTFVHEYTHFLLNKSEFPMWLQEGIPQYIGKKINFSGCGSWINTGFDLLDWGVKEMDVDKEWTLYGYACSVFMNFDSKFGEDKTKELIKGIENINDEDVYSDSYLTKVETVLKDVSGKDITIKEFIDNKY